MKSANSSIRKTLADSHVGAITVAILLVLGMDAAVRALATPLAGVRRFVVTAIAIPGIPAHSWNLSDSIQLLVSSVGLFHAVVYALLAWLVARSVYGLGPIQCLIDFRYKVARRDHV